MTRCQKLPGAAQARRFQRTALLFVAALWVAPVSVPAADDRAVKSENAQVAQWMGQQLSTHPSADGVLHMAVQISGAADAPTTARLREAGVRLLAPLALGSYLAEVSVAGRAARAIQSGMPLKIDGLASIGPVAPATKLSPDLRARSPYSWATRQIGNEIQVEFDLKYAGTANAAAAEALITGAGGTILRRAPKFNRIRARATTDKMLPLALPNWVLAVRSVDPPAAASVTNNNQISAQLLNVDQEQAAPDSLTGKGVNVMEMDEGLIDAHPELQGRVTEVDTQGFTDTSVILIQPSRHSTHVAGTLAATGLDPRLKGMAPNAKLYSYSFQADASAYAYLDAIQSYAADVSNNSWGQYLSEYISSAECNWVGSYGSLESELDQVVNENKIALVFAMGNDRFSNLCSFQQQGGFYSTGKPAAAKNTIAVAALDEKKAVTFFSNYGPTADGRLKPDISALGSNVLSLDLRGRSIVESGTSMATPAITGTLALLVEHYRNQLSDSPSPELLKAVLLNSAVDLGNPGPDYTYGYGVPDAVEAVKTITQSRFKSGNVSASQTATFTVDVPSGAPALRVMMAYSDLAGVPGSASALVNDLDLTLKGPDGKTWLPLTLDPANPAADAAPGKNSRDPVEQVVVMNPVAGTWTITVAGTSVPSGAQQFALAWNLASVEAQPSCTRSIAVAPGGLSVGASGGPLTLAITQSRSCSPLRVTYPDSWIQGASTPVTGTMPIKLNVDPNATTAQRISTLQFSDGVTDPLTVPVIQASPCFVGSITPGTPLNGTINSSDCLSIYNTYQRLYTFTGKAGQALSATLDSEVINQVLALQMPDGTEILESDYINDPTVQIPQGNRGFVLPFDGQYTLVVSTYFSDEVGPFTLSLNFPDRATLASVVKWNFVSACPQDGSGALNADSPHDGHRGTLFPVDSYIVYGGLGDTIRATVSGAGFDPVIYAMPLATENIVAAADNALPGKPASIAYQVLKPGFYTVQVTPYLFGQSGDYQVSLTGCRTPPWLPSVHPHVPLPCCEPVRR